MKVITPPINRAKLEPFDKTNAGNLHKYRLSAFLSSGKPLYPQGAKIPSLSQSSLSRLSSSCSFSRFTPHLFSHFSFIPFVCKAFLHMFDNKIRPHRMDFPLYNVLLFLNIFSSLGYGFLSLEDKGRCLGIWRI